MNDLTYEDVLLLYELVIKEERRIKKQIEPDIWRAPLKIFRPGLFKRLNWLLEIERKLNSLGTEKMKGE